jgi:bacteriorhodopsin
VSLKHGDRSGEGEIDHLVFTGNNFAGSQYIKRGDLQLSVCFTVSCSYTDVMYFNVFTLWSFSSPLVSSNSPTVERALYVYVYVVMLVFVFGSIFLKTAEQYGLGAKG